MSKPIHPATVHFPLAFLMLAYGLDIYHAAAPSLPSLITSYAPASPELPRASYNLILAGLISFVPAVASGAQQALVLFAKQGFYETDGKTIKPKVKATVVHGITMDLVLAAAAYLWSVRRAAVTGALVGSEGAYVADAWVVAAQGAIMGLMGFSAGIGGTLTYNYGVGFQSMVAGKRKAQ